MVPQLLWLLSALPSWSPAGEGILPRLEVREGCVSLLAPDGVALRTPADGLIELTQQGRVDLGARTRAELAWPGVGAVRLEGPGGFEWGGPAPLEAWRIDGLRAADVEVRRGPLLLAPAPGWRLELGRGAWRVERAAEGGVRVRALLGGTARALWRGEPRRAVPPLSIWAGEALRLDGPPPVPDRRPLTVAPRWSRVRWPFGRPSARTLALFERATRPPWPRPEWPFGPAEELAAPWPAASWPWACAAAPQSSSESASSSVTGWATPPWM